MQARRLIRGSTPLLVSVPHAGTFVPADIRARMTDAGRDLPDTDFFVDRLYDFAADMGAGILSATHARYVIDLNRGIDDGELYPGQVKTGLCPVQTFDGRDIYQAGDEPDAVERANRIGAYWMPYHDMLRMELERLRDTFGYAILYDAHSIKSRVPRLFEGELPALNVGTAQGASCAPGMAEAVFAAAGDRYAKVLNGRFVGGHITRHYGDPARHIHAVQMEIAQRYYMDEESRLWRSPAAEELRGVLRDILSALLAWGAAAYPAKS